MSSKKLTITVDEEVYHGLHAVVGRRNISRFLTDLARPHVLQHDLAGAYEQMAREESRERDALEWADDLIEDVADEPR